MNGLFSKDYSKMTDYEVGVEALKFFEKHSRDYYPDATTFTLKDLQNYYDNMRGNQIQGLGLGIKFTEIDDDQLEDSMEALAVKAKGQIPNNLSLFRQEIQGTLQRIDPLSWDFFDNVIKKSATDVVLGVSKAGQGLINVGEATVFWSKYAKYWLPVAGLGIFGLLTYLYGGKLIALVKAEK